MRRRKPLAYSRMPKVIQNLVDGMEFLKAVYQIRRKGKTLYCFVFEDSFERWYRFYDGKEKKYQSHHFIQSKVN